ncbi:NAD(P)-binding protein [Halobacillus sp. Marseille-Q1614]|uniref:NAD(P)-binding protein n=1 Tax=Halobacillus sp. Marseille-Q1614 TaxID=2709134 RepID=UPI00157048BE|nr:NAD(P)-binding protein [Halobacillus sp. Marseille-Q1614]
MEIIPLMIQLEGRKVFVIGGGRIAERRILSLLPAHANLEVISPEVSSAIHSLHKEGKITWHQKTAEREDLQEAFLIISAANMPEMDQLVSQWAPPHALVNCAGNHQYGNVHFPSTFKRGRLQISISTSGASPILTSRIKKDLEGQYDERYEHYVDFLFEARSLIKQSQLSKEEKQSLLRKIVEEDYLDSNKQQQILTRFKK